MHDMSSLTIDKISPKIVMRKGNCVYTFLCKYTKWRREKFD